jgi:hypothetical protein
MKKEIQYISKRGTALFRNYKTEDSPVEKRRKELPQGNCDWVGWEYVANNLKNAAQKMALSDYWLSDWHIETMAVLGCGHEETMKAHQMLLRTYNWI